MYHHHICFTVSEAMRYTGIMSGVLSWCKMARKKQVVDLGVRQRQVFVHFWLADGWFPAAVPPNGWLMIEHNGGWLSPNGWLIFQFLVNPGDIALKFCDRFLMCLYPFGWLTWLWIPNPAVGFPLRSQLRPYRRDWDYQLTNHGYRG